MADIARLRIASGPGLCLQSYTLCFASFVTQLKVYDLDILRNRSMLDFEDVSLASWFDLTRTNVKPYYNVCLLFRNEDQLT